MDNDIYFPGLARKRLDEIAHVKTVIKYLVIHTCNLFPWMSTAEYFQYLGFIIRSGLVKALNYQKTSISLLLPFFLNVIFHLSTTKHVSRYHGK